MICPKCGNNNREECVFCTSCGAPLVDMSVFENEKTEDLDEYKNVGNADLKAFESEKTEDLVDIRAFENEKTEILDDYRSVAIADKPVAETEVKADFADIKAFENEKTEILEDYRSTGPADLQAFENEKTEILDDGSANRILSDSFIESGEAPTFKYTGNVPVYKEDGNDRTIDSDDALYEEPGRAKNEANRSNVPVQPPQNSAAAQGYDPDLSYIKQLRGLKELLDDGIITEREFEQKKKILLGL